MSSKAEDIKQLRVEGLLDSETATFIRFNGSLLFRVTQEAPAFSTKGYEVCTFPRFAEYAYSDGVFGSGIGGNQLRDIYHTLEARATDRSDLSRYIGFRDGQVWDMRKLCFAPNQLDFVYSSDVSPMPVTESVRQFLLDLGAGDEGVAGDIVQSIAPIFMERKPDGVIWFIGNGANGKSTVLKMVERIVQRHKTSVTPYQLEDERQVVSLNGALANICQEASEKRIEDSSNYKLLGTHDYFEVRRLGTHDKIGVHPLCHTIFNANNVSVFGDKTKGVTRRTLLVPFMASFKSDPTFEDKVLAPEFLGGLLTLVLEATLPIRDHGYTYDWSAKTIEMKKNYDAEANSADAYVDYLTDRAIQGFYNFKMLKLHYDNWCGMTGRNALGMMLLNRAVSETLGASPRVVRDEQGRSVRRYYFRTAPEDVTWLESEGLAVETPTNAAVAKQLALDSQRGRLSDEW